MPASVRPSDSNPSVAERTAPQAHPLRLMRLAN